MKDLGTATDKDGLRTPFVGQGDPRPTDLLTQTHVPCRLWIFGRLEKTNLRLQRRGHWTHATAAIRGAIPTTPRRTVTISDSMTELAAVCRPGHVAHALIDGTQRWWSLRRNHGRGWRVGCRRLPLR
jgi:hypothetical protein